MLLFIWLSIHLCVHELCSGSCVGSCWGSWAEGGAVWVDVWGKLLKDCVGELGKLCVVEPCGGAVWLGGWGYMSVGHAHQ